MEVEQRMVHRALQLGVCINDIHYMLNGDTLNLNNIGANIKNFEHFGFGSHTMNQLITLTAEYCKGE